MKWVFREKYFIIDFSECIFSFSFSSHDVLLLFTSKECSFYVLTSFALCLMTHDLLIICTFYTRFPYPYWTIFRLQARIVVDTFVTKAAIDPVKDPFGKTMRFGHKFTVLCTVLRMKSNKAYNFLRDNLLLPLPSPKTIRRLLSSSECKFGFNELALKLGL